MLLAEPSGQTRPLLQRDKVEIIDTDDGVSESIMYSVLASYDLKIDNIKFKGDIPIISHSSEYMRYSIDDIMFVFSINRVIVVFDNDYCINVTVSGRRLIVNDEDTGTYCDALGIPMRDSISSEFYVNAYFAYKFERIVQLTKNNAVYKKGIRSLLMRKILYS